jgi:hypothetical protein|nr:MAG TPA: TRAF PROTEIN, TRAO PROTEIN, TRAN ADHESION, BACTERIAL SECRETION.5A [Caudoviricetes sp.]
MKPLIAILATLAMTGCVSKAVHEAEVKQLTVELEKVKTQTVIVNKPVIYCPAPKIPAKPKLAIQSISPQSPNSDVLRAYGQSVEQLINYSNTLRRNLKSYEGLDKRVNKEQ